MYCTGEKKIYGNGYEYSEGEIRTRRERTRERDKEGEIRTTRETTRENERERERERLMNKEKMEGREEV